MENEARVGGGDLGRRVGRAVAAGGPTSIDLHFTLCNSAVSSPIWTIDRSQDSRGPWLSRRLSIVLARDRLNPLPNTTRGILNRYRS